MQPDQPILSVPPTVLQAGVPVAARPWPPDSDHVRLQLDDSLFLTGRVRIDIELSWDGGKTYPYLDTTEWNAGAKDRHGNPPMVQLGPFRQGTAAHPDGETMNPTHYKATLVPTLGSPTVGVKLLVG